jgi:hypothetical protein
MSIQLLPALILLFLAMAFLGTAFTIRLIIERRRNRTDA